MVNTVSFERGRAACRPGCKDWPRHCLFRGVSGLTWGNCRDAVNGSPSRVDGIIYPPNADHANPHGSADRWHLARPISLLSQNRSLSFSSWPGFYSKPAFGPNLRRAGALDQIPTVVSVYAAEITSPLQLLFGERAKADENPLPIFPTTVRADV